MPRLLTNTSPPSGGNNMLTNSSSSNNNNAAATAPPLIFDQSIHTNATLSGHAGMGTEGGEGNHSTYLSSSSNIVAVDRQLRAPSCHGCAAKLTFFPLEQSSLHHGGMASVSSCGGGGGGATSPSVDSSPVTSSDYFRSEYDTLEDQLEERAVEATHCLNCGGLFCYRCASIRVPEQPALGLVMPLHPTMTATTATASSCAADAIIAASVIPQPLAIAFTPTTPQESLEATSHNAYYVKLYEDEALANGYVGAGVANFITANAAVARVSNIFGSIAGAVSSAFSSSNENNNGRSGGGGGAGGGEGAGILSSSSASSASPQSSRLRRNSTMTTTRNRLTTAEDSTNNENNDNSANSGGGTTDGSSSVFDNLQAKEFKNRPVPLCVSCYVHDVGYLLAFNLRLRGYHTLLFTSPEIAANYVRLHVPTYASRLVLHIGTGNVILSRYANDESERKLIEVALKERQRVKSTASRHHFSFRDHFSRRLGILKELEAKIAAAELSAGGNDYGDVDENGEDTAATPTSSSSSSLLASLRAKHSLLSAELFPFSCRDLQQMSDGNDAYEGLVTEGLIQEARRVVKITDDEIQRNFDLIPTNDDDDDEVDGGNGNDNDGEPNSTAAPPTHNGDRQFSDISTTAAEGLRNNSMAVPPTVDNSDYSILESAHRLDRGRSDLYASYPNSRGGSLAPSPRASEFVGGGGGGPPAPSPMNMTVTDSALLSTRAVRGGDTNLRFARNDLIIGDMLPETLLYRGGAGGGGMPIGHHRRQTQAGPTTHNVVDSVTGAVSSTTSNKTRLPNQNQNNNSNSDAWMQSIAKGHFTDANSYAKQAVQRALTAQKRQRYEKGSSLAVIEGCLYLTSLLVVWRSEDGCFEHCFVPVVPSSSSSSSTSAAGDIDNVDIDDCAGNPPHLSNNNDDLCGTKDALQRAKGMLLAGAPHHSATASSPSPSRPRVAYGCVFDLTGKAILVVDNTNQKKAPLAPPPARRSGNQQPPNHRSNPRTNRLPSPPPMNATSVPSNHSRGSRYISNNHNNDDDDNDYDGVTSPPHHRQVSESPSSSWTMVGGGGNSSNELLLQRGIGSAATLAPTTTVSGSRMTLLGISAEANNSNSDDEGLVATPRGGGDDNDNFNVDASGFSSIAHARRGGTTGSGAAPPSSSSSPAAPARITSPPPPTTVSVAGIVYSPSAASAALLAAKQAKEASIARECLLYALTCVKVVRAVTRATEKDKELTGRVAAMMMMMEGASAAAANANGGSVEYGRTSEATTQQSAASSAVASPTTGLVGPNSNSSSPGGNSNNISFYFYKSPFEAMSAMFKNATMMSSIRSNAISSTSPSPASSFVASPQQQSASVTCIASHSCCALNTTVAELLLDPHGGIIGAYNLGHGSPEGVANRDVLARRAGKAMQQAQQGQRLQHLFVVVPLRQQQFQQHHQQATPPPPPPAASTAVVARRGGNNNSRTPSPAVSSRTTSPTTAAGASAVPPIVLSSSRHLHDLVTSLSTPRGGGANSNSNTSTSTHTTQRTGTALPHPPALRPTQPRFSEGPPPSATRSGGGGGRPSSNNSPPPPRATTAGPSASFSPQLQQQQPQMQQSTNNTVLDSEDVLVFPCSSLYDAANMLRDYQTGILIAQTRGQDYRHHHNHSNGNNSASSSAASPSSSLFDHDALSKVFSVYHRHPSVCRKGVIDLFAAAMRSQMLSAFVHGHAIQRRGERGGGVEGDDDDDGEGTGRRTDRDEFYNEDDDHDEDRHALSSSSSSSPPIATSQARSRVFNAAERQRRLAEEIRKEREAEIERERLRLIKEEAERAAREERDRRERERRAAALECPICMEEFNVSERRPCLCPSCGNSFCLSCGEQLKICSFCRANLARNVSPARNNNNNNGQRRTPPPAGAAGGANGGIGDMLARFAGGMAASGGGGGSGSASSSPSQRFVTNVALMHMLEQQRSHQDE